MRILERCSSRIYLFKEAMNECNRPDDTSQMIPYAAGQELIPDEHRVIHHMPSLAVAEVLL